MVVFFEKFLHQKTERDVSKLPLFLLENVVFFEFSMCKRHFFTMLRRFCALKSTLFSSSVPCLSPLSSSYLLFSSVVSLLSLFCSSLLFRTEHYLPGGVRHQRKNSGPKVSAPNSHLSDGQAGANCETLWRVTSMFAHLHIMPMPFSAKLSTFFQLDPPEKHSRQKPSRFGACNHKKHRG